MKSYFVHKMDMELPEDMVDSLVVAAASDIHGLVVDSNWQDMCLAPVADLLNA